SHGSSRTHPPSGWTFRSAMHKDAFRLGGLIVEHIAPALLDWFRRNRRSLPFRDDPTPYHIWVSEIMLQQTRVAAALPYYERFVLTMHTITYHVTFNTV